MSDLETSTEIPAEVLKQGSTPVIWKSDKNPVVDFLTRVAAAAFAVGFDLLTPKCFQNHVYVDEDRPLQPGEEPRRSVTWIWDGKQTVTFTPIPAAETITIQEFEKRFNDLTWVEANPDHPISYMRAFIKQSRDTMISAKAEPCLRIQRGENEVVAPPGATPEEIEEAFADLEDFLARR